MDFGLKLKGNYCSGFGFLKHHPVSVLEERDCTRHPALPRELEASYLSPKSLSVTKSHSEEGAAPHTEPSS